jgi:hypothetical protein
VRRDQPGAAQVKAAVGEHRQEFRVLPRGPGHGDAEVGLGLREVQDAQAVHEHGGRRAACVEPPCIDLADVRDQLGLDAARLSHEVAQAAEQLGVGQGSKALSGLHAPQYRNGVVNRRR